MDLWHPHENILNGEGSIFVFWYIIICLLMLYPFGIVYVGVISGKKTQCIALGISCFILWLFMALRDVSVGVDTKYYAHVFQQLQNIPFSEIFTTDTYATSSATWTMNFEYGYRMYNKLISCLSGSVQTLIVCNSTLILLLLFVLIRNHSPNFMLSIWLYITLGIFQTEMNVGRNAIAILIAYLGFRFLEERRGMSYVACCITAMLFHKAAILFLPIYWLVHHVHWNQKKMRRVVLFSLILGVLFPYITPYLERYLPYFITKYFASSFSKGEAVMVGILHLILFLFLYYMMDQTEREKIFQQYKLGTTLFVLNLSCFSFTLGIGYAARIAALFGPYLILYLPQILTLIESEKKRNVMTILLIAGCGLQYVLRLCVNNIGGTMPYEFFW